MASTTCPRLRPPTRHRLRRAALALLLCLGSLGAAQAQTRLRMVTEAWPPFLIEGENGGEPSGLYVDTVREVFAQMGYVLDLRYLPFKRALMQTEDLQSDGMLGVFRTADRERIMLFPDEPMLSVNYVFFCRKGEPWRYTGPHSLTGKRIGIERGYHYTAEFDAAENFTKEPADSVESNIRKTLAGRIDCFAENSHVGLWVAMRMDVADLLEISPQPLDAGKPNYTAFARKPGYDELARRFSAQLRAFKKTERYRAILRKYGTP